MGFKELGLNDEIVSSVQEIGFEEPTSIQAMAIPEIINGGRDLVGLAQTGTGKTAAFGLPMIQLIDFSSSVVQGLVICPTRELCIQISEDFKKYSRRVKGAKIVAVYGGASIELQRNQIRKGAQIVVATPGRLLDLIKRRLLNISAISYVVLDEADEMLNMGFKEDLDEILSKTPATKRTWLFSATMPKEVAYIARNYMTNPFEITVGKKNSGATNIDHINYVVKEKDRYLALKRIIDFYPEIFGLVFCRTRKETQLVSEKLLKEGYNAEALHGDLSQSQRDNVMRKFRDGSLQILVATDVAARGLDVKDITHVINYNLPDEAENYTHRSGRTARAGKKGVSIVLMNTREGRKLADVERKAGIKFKYEMVPGGFSVCEKQLYAMVEKLVAVDVKHDAIDKYLEPVYKTLEGLSREELIQRFLSTEFNRFLNYYKDSGDINARVGRSEFPRESVRKTGPRKPFSKGGKPVVGNTQRFFINVGTLDKIREGAITRLVCERAAVQSAQIGKIEVLREFSFFEVETTVAEKVLKSMNGAMLDGRKISVQYSEKRKPRPMAARKTRRAN